MSVDFVDCLTLLADGEVLWKQLYCEASLTFGFPDSHWLRLDIALGEHQLEHLDADDDEPQLVGTVDANELSDLFRWEEFRTVSRHLARTTEPGWAIELLFSFYVAVPADCAVEHAATLRQALERSQVFSDPEVEYILAYTRQTAQARAAGRVTTRADRAGCAARGPVSRSPAARPE